MPWPKFNNMKMYEDMQPYPLLTCKFYTSVKGKVYGDHNLNNYTVENQLSSSTSSLIKMKRKFKSLRKQMDGTILQPA